MYIVFCLLFLKMPNSKFIILYKVFDISYPLFVFTYVIVWYKFWIRNYNTLCRGHFYSAHIQDFKE